MKVGIGGPSSSGKSTFCFVLYRYLDRDSRITVAYETLDVWDQTVDWLLDNTGEVERKNEDADRSDAVNQLTAVNGRCEDIVLCDLPGSLEPPIEDLVEPLDTIILLGHRENTYELESWMELTREKNISIFSVIMTHLQDEPEAIWNPETKRGILRQLDRDTVAQTYLEGLPTDTLNSIQLISSNLKRRSRTN